jgi:hypothetical protein
VALPSVSVVPKGKYNYIGGRKELCKYVVVEIYWPGKDTQPSTISTLVPHPNVWYIYTHTSTPSSFRHTHSLSIDIYIFNCVPYEQIYKTVLDCREKNVHQINLLDTIHPRPKKIVDFIGMKK